MRFAIGLTGASGVVYGLRLLRILAEQGVTADVCISDHAAEVLRLERDQKVDLQRADLAALLGTPCPTLRYFHRKDFTAPFASGSARYTAMAIVPCSMGTVGKIASGCTDDLITRGADVFLKERRRLIIVPRETPLNSIHLRNLLTLSEAGAVILPAMPSFYSRPGSVEELVDTVVNRILDHLGLEITLRPRWGEKGGERP